MVDGRSPTPVHRRQMNAPSGRQSVLFFLQPTDISASLSPPPEAPLHSQRIGVEVSEQSLQALPDLLVRGPIGEGALPQHGVVAQLHRTLPIGIAFLERALKPVNGTKLQLVHLIIRALGRLKAVILLPMWPEDSCYQLSWHPSKIVSNFPILLVSPTMLPYFHQYH